MKKLIILFSIIISLISITACGNGEPMTTENTTNSTTTNTLPTEKVPINLPAHYQNGMIFQQNKPITINGTTKADSSLTIEILEAKTNKSIEKQEITADNEGKFQVTFSPISASFTEYKIVLLNSTTYRSLNNILFGEVWLTSGQSNMRWPIRLMKNRTQYVNRVKDNNYIKYFDQTRYPNNDKSSNMSFIPLDEFNNPIWHNLNNYTFAKEASAVAYVFATELFDYLNQNGKEVPVAFIQSAVDASSIHSWLSKETIDKTYSVKSYLMQNNIYISSDTEMNKFGNNNYNQMSVLYNHKIHPLKNTAISGVLWHQGAADYAHHIYYENAMTALINQYREMFSDVPVLAVQQHSFDNANAKYLRLAQSDAMNNNDLTAIIPSYDIDPEFEFQDGYDMDPTSGNTAHHPINKIEIGIRLCNAATTLIYGNTENHLTPILEKYEIINNNVILTIKNATEISIKNNEHLKNFTIRTATGKLNLDVTFNNNTIIFPYSSDITFVEYAFENINYKSNLVNEKGLPLIPFRVQIKHN